MDGNRRNVADPFSLQHFLEQADGVGLTVLAVLVLMSLGSWYVIFTKLWDQWRVQQAHRALESKFWRADDLQQGCGALAEPDNVFRMLVEDGVRALQHHASHLRQHVDLNDWMTVSLYRAADGVNRRLVRGLAILASVGSVSPFVGLMGTVWGIYNALLAISLTGNPSLENISGPIGEALVMTFIGLFVAIPAVLGYNWLLRRNRDLQEKIRDFCADLHAYLIGGARIDQRAPIVRAAPERTTAALHG